MIYRPFILLLASLSTFCSLHAALAKATAGKSLTKNEAIEARDSIVRHFNDSISKETSTIYDKHLVCVGDRKMHFHWETYGNAPKGKRSLWISLHGGGGVPYREYNIQQWTNQWRLYQPQEGIYLCPLSPVDAWDMWCQADADEFYHKIILMAVTHLGVDPDKVYILGYSAGGDGVWRMGPRMADTWAAASMMAGHPGDVRLENLRNLPFMVWCGAKDYAYDRNKLCAERIVQLDSLQHADNEGYIHGGTIVKDCGHWMNRADTAAITWMAKYQRNPYPKKIVWQQEEVLRQSFYWISAPENELARYRQVRLHVNNNTIYLDTCDYSMLTLWLNDQLVDLDKKVSVVYKGRKIFSGKIQRTVANLKESLSKREDSSYAFPAKIVVKTSK